MDTAIVLLTVFFSSVFLALQMCFWAQGDSHMMTLMCGMCLLCCGIGNGWSRAGKRKGGDDE